jgi:hypothetical protein
MTDALLDPLFTLVSIALPVGIACLTIAITAVLAPRVVGSLRQRSYDRAAATDRRRWAIRLDPATAADPEAGRRLVAALHPGARRGFSPWASGWPSVVLAIRWDRGRARWEIEAPRQLSRPVETAVAAAYPSAELEELDPAVTPADALRLSVSGQPPESERRGAADLGSILVELLARLPKAASAAWILDIRPLAPRDRAAPDDAPRMTEMALDSLLNRPSRTFAPRNAMTSHDDSGPSFSVTAHLEASSGTEGATRSWLFDAMAAVGTLRASGWRIKAAIGGRSAPITVDTAQLADLWGLAGAAHESRPVDVVRSRHLAAPFVDPGPGLRPIADDAGRPVLVPEGTLARHVFILGRTGAGKSTELIALAADDLRAGRGFTFLDPHGDAVAKLLDAVPKDQARRVHLLELAERNRPRAFNPIELDGAEPELVASQFVDTMRDLYFATLGSAYRQIQYLRNALMTVLTLPPVGGVPWTLNTLYSLFVDPKFREGFTRHINDPVLTPFWQHQWQQNTRGGDPSADAIVSKLGAFLGYPSIRAIVSAPVSTIRPRQIMDDGDVLLVDLSGVGRDHMRLFGSLLIARFGVAALGRQRVPPADRTPHTLYVDEVQNFDTTSLRSIPAEGRKFGLQINMATQYVKALGQELQSAIRANVATIMLLQPSSEDAHLLGDLMAPLTERDLINLPRFGMAIRTELDGQATVLTANVLPEPPRFGLGGLVRRLSDERDGRTPRP